MLRRRWLELALCAAALASGPLALVAWNNGMGRGGFASPVGGEKWFAPRPGFFEARGIGEPELSPTGSVFNWTTTDASLHFPRLERSRRAVVTLRIQGQPPRAGQSPDVVISVDGIETERLEVPGTPRRVSVDLPPRAGRGAVVSIRVEGKIGVMVENVRLGPREGTIPLPREALGALAFLALAVYLAALLAGASPPAALVTTLAAATLISWLASTGGAFLGRYSERLAWIAVWSLLLSVAATRIRDGIWRRAWIAVIWISALKLLVLSHPQVIDADAAIHTGNLRRALGGDWFFTSATPPPAISFPYPQGLSLVALPFTGLPQSEWATLLRVIVLIAEAVCAFAFSASVAALSTTSMGAVTFVLIALSPEGVALLFVGNLTNLFSDALLMLACAFMMVSRPLLASLSLLGAFLSHLGALLLGAPLVFLLTFTRGEMPTALRRTWPVLLAVASAFVLYYRRFTSVVVEALERMRGLKGGASSTGPMTAPLGEKLERIVLGQDWWITVIGVTLLAIGIATWPAGRKTLARILFVWILVIVAFTALGLFTPVQVRSALAARPAVAALCASAVCALWVLGGARRVLAAALVTLVAIGSWTIAVGFFPVRPS